MTEILTSVSSYKQLDRTGLEDSQGASFDATRSLPSKYMAPSGRFASGENKSYEVRQESQNLSSAQQRPLSKSVGFSVSNFFTPQRQVKHMPPSYRNTGQPQTGPSSEDTSKTNPKALMAELETPESQVKELEMSVLSRVETQHLDGQQSAPGGASPSTKQQLKNETVKIPFSESAKSCGSELVNALKKRDIKKVKELTAFSAKEVSVSFEHEKKSVESEWLNIEAPNIDVSKVVNELENFNEKEPKDVATANALFKEPAISFQVKKHGIQDDVFGSLDDSSAPANLALKKNNREITSHLIKSEAEARDISPFYIVVKRKLTSLIGRLFRFALSNSHAEPRTEGAKNLMPYTVTPEEINEKFKSDKSDKSDYTLLTMLLDNGELGVFNGIVSKGDVEKSWLLNAHKNMLKEKLQASIKSDPSNTQLRDACFYLGIRPGK
ncbi:hypothetical protein SOPP22_17550 [Shewanella sp. OPT22]|nr:hypothetical protein SOPP22_17550 [Shewanella sp. OPT22]